MRLAEYVQDVLTPAYTAIGAMRRAGIPVCEERAQAQMGKWETELKEMEKEIEDLAISKGFTFHYSAAHSPVPAKSFRDFLYSPNGLGLEISRRSEETGEASTDDEALRDYAAIGSTHNVMNGQPFEDDPRVYQILKIRSISKARSTHLGGLLKWRRADGCCHAQFHWNNRNTTRLSASDPAVHQLPERADPEVARAVKACIVPRSHAWLGSPDDWDPRKHGWVAKADIKGAEAVVRAGCIARCHVSRPYLREGKDIHSKTASILYQVPEGTYKKGTYQRDSVGKTSYFLLIFGGSWKALQLALWKEARIWLSDEDAQKLHQRFFEGYGDLKVQIDNDTALIFERGYIEDDYGRRWRMPPPPGVRWDGERILYPPKISKEEFVLLRRQMDHIQHCYSNRRTQCDQGTTTLFVLALLYHGEYVDLQCPPVWESSGLLYPETQEYQLNGGRGPGGKPFQVWLMNTVHDSGWFDGGPGTLEPAVKVITRRANGVPADFLIENNMPWRVEIEVGPDLGTLYPYSVVAKRFNLEPLLSR